MVTGPAAPMMATWLAPMRRNASEVTNTGNTVQPTAMPIARPYTCGGSCSADSGRSSRNCSMHRMLATLVA